MFSNDKRHCSYILPQEEKKIKFHSVPFEKDFKNYVKMLRSVLLVIMDLKVSLTVRSAMRTFGISSYRYKESNATIRRSFG